MDKSIFICRFCGKKCKNSNSLIQHELRCYKNPNCIDKINFETYEKSPKLCPICGGVIPYKKRHQKSCSPECGFVLRANSAKLTHKLNDNIDVECKYCGKICKNDNSLRNHERLCKLNPNRQIMLYNNLEKYNENIHNGEQKVWNKGLTKENDERVLKGSKKFLESIKSGKYIPKRTKHTEEYKKKIKDFTKRYKLWT